MPNAGDDTPKGESTNKNTQMTHEQDGHLTDELSDDELYTHVAECTIPFADCPICKYLL